MSMFRSSLIVILLLTFCIPACNGQRAHELTRSEILMDTVVEIKVRGGRAGDIDAAFDEMRRIEAHMSRFTSSSELNRVNAHAGKGRIAVSDDMWEALVAALRVAKQSSGAFDPTIGPAVSLWAKKRLAPPSAEELNRLKDFIGWRRIKLHDAHTISLDTGMSINLDGIAKGYAVDRALDILKGRGCKAALVNAGGDIGCYAHESMPKWVVEIEGANKKNTPPLIRIRHGAVATSGNGRRFYMIGDTRFSHVLDPNTLRPVGRDVITASAILRGESRASTAADAWATAAMVRGAAIFKAADSLGIGIAIEGRDGVWNFNRAWPRHDGTPFPFGKP